VRALISCCPRLLIYTILLKVILNTNLINYSGASPIMSPNGDEAGDLARFKGALLINMGTLTSESVSQYLKAITAYNRGSNPVVFDPVGAALRGFEKRQ